MFFFCTRHISGKKCFDLLGMRKGTEVRLMDTGRGRVDVHGAVKVACSTSAELRRIIEIGHCRRSTDATDVNATSSRSHAVLQVQIFATSDKPSKHELGDLDVEDRPFLAMGAQREFGILTLVDCAGSERKEDSMYHSKQRRKEGAEINASLHALKECIRRTRLKQIAELNGDSRTIHVPFRSSNLTKVLMESFTTAGAELVVIGTVSPTPTDTEHSESTLQTCCMLNGMTNLVSENIVFHFIKIVFANFWLVWFV